MSLLKLKKRQHALFTAKFGKKMTRGLGYGMIVFGIAVLIIQLLTKQLFLTATAPNRLPPAGSFFPGAETFTFAVMSDSHMRTTTMEKVFADIKSKHPSFLLHAGDLSRRLNTSHFEWILQELNADLGEYPLYAVPGNHDTIPKNDPPESFKGDPGRFYDRAFGQRYYWFAYGETLILGLDDSHGFFDDAQLRWADQVFRRLRPQFKTCVIFMHVPPEQEPVRQAKMNEGETFSYADTDPSLVGKYTPSFHELVSKYDVDLIFTGHLHQYVETEYAGVRMITVPPSGGRLRGNTKTHGYVLCTVDNTSGVLETTLVPVTPERNIERVEFFMASEFPRATWLPWVALASLCLGPLFLVRWKIFCALENNLPLSGS